MLLKNVNHCPLNPPTHTLCTQPRARRTKSCCFEALHGTQPKSPECRWHLEHPSKYSTSSRSCPNTVYKHLFTNCSRTPFTNTSPTCSQTTFTKRSQTTVSRAVREQCSRTAHKSFMNRSRAIKPPPDSSSSSSSSQAALRGRDCIGTV